MILQPVQVARSGRTTTTLDLQLAVRVNPAEPAKAQCRWDRPQLLLASGAMLAFSSHLLAKGCACNALQVHTQKPVLLAALHVELGLTLLQGPPPAPLVPLVSIRTTRAAPTAAFVLLDISAL